MNIKIPGAAWVALIGGLSVWLSTYFDAPWAAATVAALGALAKGLEVYMAKQPAAPPPGVASAPASEWDRPVVRWWVRLLWG